MGFGDVPSFLYPHSIPKVATVIFLRVSCAFGRIRRNEAPLGLPIFGFRAFADHFGYAPCIEGLCISKDRLETEIDPNLHDEMRSLGN